MSQPYSQVEKGSAVVVRGSNAIGIVTTIDRGQGSAWVVWPDNCGLSEAQPIDSLQMVCDRTTLIQALQVIAPARQLANPLERAFQSAAHSRSSITVVDADDIGHTYRRR